jgi:hypothetical protein
MIKTAQVLGLLVLVCVAYANAQGISAEDAAPTADSVVRRESVVPRILKHTGILKDLHGEPIVGIATVSFAFYDAESSITPLWLETLNVEADAFGRFTALIGTSYPDGLPADLFRENAARWLGVRIAREGEQELPRIQLVSVPYALKAADAERLGGFSVNDFQLTPEAAKRAGMETSAYRSIEIAGAGDVGTPNRVAKFAANGVNLIDSAITESANRVGVNNPVPQFELDVVGAAVFGQATERFAFRSGSLGFNRNVNTGAIFDNSRNAFQIQHIANADPALDYLSIQTYSSAGVNTNASAMAITAAGRVGFGTTAPTQPLDVRGTAVFGADNERFSFRSSSLGFNRNVSSGQIYDPTRFAYQWEHSGSAIAANDNLAVQVYNTAGANLSANALSINGLGNVGVNTANPSQRLEVAGNIRITGGSLIFADGSTQSTALGIGSTLSGANGTEILRVTQTASIGVAPSVGVTPPSGIRGHASTATGFAAGAVGSAVSPDGFGVYGLNTATTGNGTAVFGLSTSTSGTGIWGDVTATTGDAVGLFGRSASAAGGTGVWGEVVAGTGVNFGVYGRVTTPGSGNTGSAAGVFDTTTTANILVGRSGGTPTNVFRVSSTGQVFGSGAFLSSGADFAEAVGIQGDPSAYHPGDVLGIDTDGVRRFKKVAVPYSPLVAGIYSTKPGIVGHPYDVNDRERGDEIPLAVVGIVPCKVSDENGPIRVGDLLVSSSTPGYAMRGTDRSRMNGAVIGKALQPMAGTTGVIEVLVSLQ